MIQVPAWSTIVLYVAGLVIGYWIGRRRPVWCPGCNAVMQARRFRMPQRPTWRE